MQDVTPGLLLPCQWQPVAVVEFNFAEIEAILVARGMYRVRYDGLVSSGTVMVTCRQ